MNNDLNNNSNPVGVQPVSTTTIQPQGVSVTPSVGQPTPEVVQQPVVNPQPIQQPVQTQSMPQNDENLFNQVFQVPQPVQSQPVQQVVNPQPVVERLAQVQPVQSQPVQPVVSVQPTVQPASPQPAIIQTPAQVPAQSVEQPVVDEQVKTAIESSQGEGVIQAGPAPVSEVTTQNNGTDATQNKKNDPFIFIFFGVTVVAVIACLLYMTGIIGGKKVNKPASTTTLTETEESTKEIKEDEKKEVKLDPEHTFYINAYALKIPDNYYVAVYSEDGDNVIFLSNDDSNHSFGLSFEKYVSMSKLAAYYKETVIPLNEEAGETTVFADYVKYGTDTWYVYTRMNAGETDTVAYTYFQSGMMMVTMGNESHDYNLSLIKELNSIFKNVTKKPDNSV